MGRFQIKTAVRKEDIHMTAPPGKPFLPFWMPGEELPPDSSANVRPMASKTLVNILNYLHFSDRSLFAHVQENWDRTGYLLPVFPEPCLDGEISCRFTPDSPIGEWEKVVRNLIIDDGKSMIMVPVHLKDKDKESFTIILPETSYVIARREARRYPCAGVSAEVHHNGRRITGELEDMGPTAIRLKVDRAGFLSESGPKEKEIVSVELKRGGVCCYSGKASCLRMQEKRGNWEMVLQPSVQSVQVFQKRSVRNPRVKLTPPPTISFKHPLLQTNFRIEVSDICSSGFSISENARNCLLLPGMHIPDMGIQYAGSTIMHCPGQVVYRKNNGDGNTRCGIAVLDATMDGYTRLNHLVENAMDPCAQISGEVDPDALWEFFFSTGFVYPKKYRSMGSAKDRFKENCEKLYQKQSDIARHFVYQRNGRIYGHLSILRAYERSWMIHHHAGRALERRKSGLIVLRQVMHFFNDFARLPSLDMKYAMAFFRPENRFPNMVFGGLEKDLKNRKICSMDLFSYFPLARFSFAREFENGWHLNESTLYDKMLLEEFYEAQSGGLLLDAMSIANADDGNSNLEAVYFQNNLLRKTKVYTLKQANQAVAIFIADYSSRGINFSELMNCIKVIILKGVDLPWDVFRSAVSQLSKGYPMKKVPVMCYPAKYLEEKGVAPDKAYQIWVFRLRDVDLFTEYMQKRFKLS